MNKRDYPTENRSPKNKCLSKHFNYNINQEVKSYAAVCCFLLFIIMIYINNNNKYGNVFDIYFFVKYANYINYL